MRACQCNCTSPPHRYLEDDEGVVWYERVFDGRPSGWGVAGYSWPGGSLEMMQRIDPDPVWGDIVRAQLMGGEISDG